MQPTLSIQLAKLHARDLAREAARRRIQPQRRRRLVRTGR
jgi:hypothetical protein